MPRKVWIPVASVAAIALLGLWAVALRGGAGYRTVRRIDPSFAKTIEFGPQRFELSRPLWTVVKDAWAPLITIREPALWPKRSRQGRRIRDAGDPGGWQFGGPFGGGVQSRLLVCGGRALLFISQMVREIPAQRQGGRTTATGHRYFELVVLAGWTDRPEAERAVTIVDEIEGPFVSEHMILDGDTARGEEILVAFAAIDGIHYLGGSVNGGSVTWSRPAPMHAVGQGQRVHYMEVRRSQTWYHLVWTEALAGDQAMNTLYHARSQVPGQGWSGPRALSRTARQRFSVVADGADVFVAWSDSRFRETQAAAFVNDSKLFIARSSNEGRTFGRPTLISDPADPRDDAKDFLLVAADRDLYVYWVPEYDAPRQHAVIDRELRTMRLLGEISDKAITTAYEERLRSVLGGTASGPKPGPEPGAGSVPVSAGRATED